MRLRKLEISDAKFMLEWMHDEEVTRYLRKDFQNKNIEDAIDFIKRSWDDKNNIHYAIVSEENEYMGTVSLKDVYMNTAELSMCVRTVAMKRGYSWVGIQSALEKAFNEYDIKSVYWCVDRKNDRAIRFFDKHNFHENKDIPEFVIDKYKDANNLKWYSCLAGDKFDAPKMVAGCKVLHINTVPTVFSGELSFFEADSSGKKLLPFEIKRIYYISKVPEGTRRGFHAHKKLRQLLFCPYGKIQLVLENDRGREEIELSDPSIGVLIDRFTWREMLWLQTGSVLCVAASEFYDEDDYIRDYDVFKRQLIKYNREQEG